MSFYNSLELLEKKWYQEILTAQLPEETSKTTKIQALEETRALFLHPGEDHPEVPHAILASGRCSDGYVNLMMLYTHTTLFDAMMRQLANRVKIELEHLDFGDEKIYVCGPALGAIVPAYLLAKHLGINFIPMFAERDKFRPEGMILDRFPVSKQGLIRLLLIEDAITTGGSTLRAHNAFTIDRQERKTDVLLAVTVIDRRISNHKLPPEWKVVSWLDHTDDDDAFKTYEPRECPLCRAGSKRLPPKSNWDQFFSFQES